ncbi:hypothetical protein BU15DRAFT_66899 [Melanogaster broomeanus]|nr:hypothetical protein BU15DRAFT_66899 [Melanogaster broomeanus]
MIFPKPLHRAPNTGHLYLPVEPLVTLPGHHVFTQRESVSHPPATTHHESPIRTCNNASVHEAPIASGATQFVPSDNDFQFEMDSDLLLTEGLHISQDPLVAVSRNSRKKLKQWQRWSLEVIPSLIQPFLEYKRLSDNLRNEVVRESSICGNDCAKRKLKIVRVTFSGLEAVVLTICPCMPAALQLLRKGYFPCAPLAPTLAIHIKVLCLLKELFVCIPPNTSAWCEALESFFRSLGYKVDAKDGIRRRFSNAYHSYCVLDLLLDKHIRHLTEASASPQQPQPSHTPTHSPTPTPCHPTHWVGLRLPHLLQPHPVSPVPKMTNNRRRLAPSSPVTFHQSTYAAGAPYASVGPSGGISVGLVQAPPLVMQLFALIGHEDDPRNPTSTVFLPQADLDEMEADVEVLRNPPRASKPTARRKGGHTVDQAQDTYEDGMRIPTSVLDGCNDSFLAADETRQKASTRFFSDTGIMVLLCRHDRVIYLANMTSAGEKQHYALALLKVLFDQLPLDFRVRVLYVIGCQLERSCCKWGFLETFLPRMTFAISVFHAFGHQWPCQLIYHPCKRAGFGLSDGEGCERFWSAIRPLIPSLRVSGTAKVWRTWEVGFSADGIIAKRRKNLLWMDSNTSGVDRATLRTEWQAQVARGTKGRKLISIQKSLEAQEAMLHELESSQLLGNIDVVTLDIQLADCHSNISRFKHVLHQKRAALGVGEQANLARLRNNAYLQQKFEMDRVERSHRKTASDASSDPPEKGTPRSNPPLPIARDGLFKLDVDDDIWQDVGLDERFQQGPPGWLSDEKVRLGIQSLLEVEHCEEEERRLATERCMMQEWFPEEWSRIQRVRETADDDLAYELGLHCADLAELCIEWQTQVSSIYVADYREEVMFEDKCGEKSEDSISNLGSDDELIATVEDFALVDEYHSQLGGEDFGIGDWDWDDMLDLDPPVIT